MILVIQARDPHKHTLILPLEFLGFHTERKDKKNRKVVRQRREREKERKEKMKKKMGGEKSKAKTQEEKTRVRRKSLRCKQTWNHFHQFELQCPAIHLRNPKPCMWAIPELGPQKALDWLQRRKLPRSPVKGDAGQREACMAGRPEALSAAPPGPQCQK